MIYSLGGGGGGGLSPASIGLAIASFVNPFTATTNAMGDGESNAVLATALTGGSITKLGIAIAGAGITPGAGINKLAIFDSSGNLLGQTVDMTTAFESAGWAEGALTAPAAVTAGKNYYLWAVSSFSGTPPDYAGPNNVMNSTQPLNGVYLGGYAVGVVTVPASFTPSGLGSQNTLPAMYGR